MKELNVQIAEFATPFPAKVFENELIENRIRFRQNSKSNSEGGFSSSIYYVSSEDAEKTIVIRERVDIENAKFEEKYRHPIHKMLVYAGLLFIVFYLVYKLVEAVS